eukprot:gene11009-9417_t
MSCLFLSAVVAAALVTADSTAPSSQLCIIGAGPGGLQLGHLAQQAGWNYIIFEQSQSAGSFFESYPVHRQLISLNKRHTGRSNKDFNLRHDWNSLLDNDDASPMTARTKARWPNADVLKAGDLFTLLIKKERADVAAGADAAPAYEHTCKVLVTATGLSKPNVPSNGQSVVVLGLGNAAFETANEIGTTAAFVHVWAARKPKIGPNGEDMHNFLSWESRYVGNLRAINAGFLDAYLLKSLDGGLGPLGLPYKYKNGTVAKTVFLGFYEPKDSWSADFVQKVNGMGIEVYENGVLTDAGAEFKIGRSELHQTARSLTVLASAVTEDIVDEMMEFATRGGDPHPLVFDKVIRCLGWKHQTNLYTKDTAPLMQANGKYPVMTSEYESVNVPGMYFAGQLGHGKDYKRSAGGFIHGYTTRFLFRVIQAKHYSNPWPESRSYTNLETWDGENVGLEPTGCNPGDTIFLCPTTAGTGAGDNDGEDASTSTTITKSRLSSANITEASPLPPSTKDHDFVGLLDHLIERINT